MKTFALYLSLLCALAATHHAAAVVKVQDDAGHTVSLERPAQRVVALAPHVTELLFAAGGGDKIVGRVSYSDYPAPAQRIPLVGDNRQLDIERIVALKPDLLVVWLEGNNERQLEQLRRLGIPIFYNRPRQLADIPDSILRLGILLGSESVARSEAGALQRQLSQLQSRYGNKPTVRAFYQVGDTPLYTLNGTHILSDALHLCGGENVFAALGVIAPVVSVEAVLQANPEVIFSGERRSKDEGGVNLWKSYPGMTAVKNGNLFTIDSDLTSRAGPRMIAGATLICEKLELARVRRKAAR